MFLYKDNRLHFNNISFCLPDNVYVNTNCDEYKECIELIPNGEDFRIIIYADQTKRTASQFFGKHEAEECYSWIGEVKSITVGKVEGYSCSYKSTYNTYTEYRFDTAGGNGSNVMGILIYGKTSADIEKVVKHAMVIQLFDSLRCK